MFAMKLLLFSDFVGMNSIPKNDFYVMFEVILIYGFSVVRCARTRKTLTKEPRRFSIPTNILSAHINNNFHRFIQLKPIIHLYIAIT